MFSHINLRLLTVLLLSLNLTLCHNNNQSPSLAFITTGQRPSSSDSLTADYSRKETIRVSDILAARKAAAAASASQQPQRHVYTFSPPPQKSKSRVVRTNNPVDSSSLRYNLPSTALIVPPSSNSAWTPQQQPSRIDVRAGDNTNQHALLHQLRPNSASPLVRRNLRRILGSDLDTEWLLVEAPSRGQEVALGQPRESIRVERRQELQEALGQLNFSLTTSDRDGLALHTSQLPASHVVSLKQWLLQLATCRIMYVIDDMGPLYWPRWVRRGICLTSGSCSWPPSKRCLPSGSKKLKMLRWVCTNEAQINNNAASQVEQRWRRDPLSSSSRRRFSSRHRTRRLPRDAYRARRRVRRLIKKLSLASQGYYCEWSPYEHTVSNECSCSRD